MRYAEQSKALLQAENPGELARLKQAGLLDEVLNEVQETYSQQESALVKQMTADLPGNLSSQERMQKENMAATTAREIASSDMIEFWRSCR